MSLAPGTNPVRIEGATRISLLLALAALLALLALALVHGHQDRPLSADWRAAVARGRYDFATGSCISCHALYPISSAGGAVDLTHEGRKRTLAWLRHEIRFPTSIRPPTPPGQADDLAAFLSSLK
jgi:mono/diheme cytochrome c family protein